MMLSDEELAAAKDVIRRGLDEDLRYGPDVTTLSTVPAGVRATASMVPREAGVIAGLDVALLVLDEVLGAGDYQVLDRVDDGARVEPGQSVLTLQAETRGLLTAERTTLNLICHLSGIATATAAWVDRSVAPTPRCGTPARRCPACVRCRNTRCGSAAGSTIGWGWATPP